MNETYVISNEYLIQSLNVFYNEMNIVISRARKELNSIKFIFDSNPKASKLLNRLQDDFDEVESRLEAIINNEWGISKSIAFDYLQDTIVDISDCVIRYKSLKASRQTQSTISINYFEQGESLRDTLVNPIWLLFNKYSNLIKNPIEGKITNSLYELIERPSLFRCGDGYKCENDLNEVLTALLGKGVQIEKKNVNGRIDVFYEPHPDSGAIIECKKLTQGGKGVNELIKKGLEQLKNRVTKSHHNLFLIIYVCSDEPTLMESAVNSTKNYIKKSYPVSGIEVDIDNSSKDHYLCCYKVALPPFIDGDKYHSLVRVYFAYLARK